MKHLLTAACLALISTQATALSCIRPDVAHSYKRASESESLHAILLGKITFDEAGLTVERLQAGVIRAGTFKGVQFGPNGQSAEIERDIAVMLSCLGPWCGSISSAPNMISFVDVTDDGFSVSSNPCGGVQFSADEPGVLDALQSCLSGGACEAQ